MFKRLLVLAFIVAAAMSATPRAHASTLTVNRVDCYIYGFSGYNGFYHCDASASGGTGSYVSYTWNIISTRGNYSLVTTSNSIDRTCFSGWPVDGTYPHAEYFTVRVTVQDSYGATASGISQPNIWCGGYQ